MTKLDYENWVLKYCPEGVDIDDFVDTLAIGCIQIIEAAHDKTKTPIKSILAGFYDKDSH